VLADRVQLARADEGDLIAVFQKSKNPIVESVTRVALSVATDRLRA
jgi:hypothetical protein